MAIKLSGARIARYKRNLANVIQGHTKAQLEDAAQWYLLAHEIAQDIARANGLTIEQSASIISALSPRCPWQRNIALAYAFARGDKVATMGQHIKTAEKARKIGFSALKGLKTNAFARNIAGDTESVTVDVWICKAAGLNKDAPNKTQYKEIERATQLLAMEIGLQPSTVQALAWIRIRGSAE